MKKYAAAISEAIVWQNSLPYVLLVGGVAGIVASFALTYDKIQVLKDASYVPDCNINPILSCGSVMSSAQADVFGVPNTIFGLVAFGMLIMFSLTLLAGATYKRWLWTAAQVMATVGMVFMHYLFFQGVYRIHAICPWCFLVWMVTIPTFMAITVHNIRAGHFGGRLPAAVRQITGYVSNHSVDILVLWYLIIFAIIGTEFWYFWRTLF